MQSLHQQTSDYQLHTNMVIKKPNCRRHKGLTEPLCRAPQQKKSVTNNELLSSCKMLHMGWSLYSITLLSFLLVLFSKTTTDNCSRLLYQFIHFVSVL